jgi:oligoendopeptidase F
MIEPGISERRNPGDWRTSLAAPERAEIPERYQWDLSRVYPDWPAWEKAFMEIESDLPAIRARQGKLGAGPDNLLGAIENILDVRQKLGILFAYASLMSDQDTRAGENTARRGRAGTLAIKFAEATSWFEPELLALPKEAVVAAVAAEPRLQLYDHFMDNVQRVRDHTLPAEQESLLASVGNIARGPRQIFIALNNADLKFPDIVDEEGRRVELTKARYSRYIKSADRRVRKAAFETCLDAYGGLINTLAANLDAHLKNHVFYAQARRYADTLENALHPNAIPNRVFHVLLETTDSHLQQIHRYTALKKRVLDLEPLCEYDLYVPLFPDAEPTFTYEEAQDLLLTVLAPLGAEYQAIVRQAFTDRWIDVYENVGKRSGAYSNGVYGITPYILLNWSGQLRDVFTLAHEMGHSLHTYFSSRKQPYVYSDYPIFTAEVASTCNEMLLLHHLLQNAATERQKLFLLDYHLTQINDTVCRQTMFAEFEWRVHREVERGETLTADTLGELYLGNLNKYWGPQVAFDGQRSPRNWCRIPHFYYNYYVYQYATAYAAATVLSERVLTGEADARQRYLEFLGSGCHRYPIETLQRAGVDMTQAQPVAEVYVLFSELLDGLETMLGRKDRS